MPAPLPATIANEVIQTVNRLMNVGHYFADSDIRIIKLFADIKKLMSANVFQGHIAKAAAFQLLGSEKEMRYHLECASKLGDINKVYEALATGLVNTGYFREAQDYYSKVASPEHGSFSNSIHIGYACFAFKTIFDFIDKAQHMKLDLKGLDTETANRAMALMHAQNLSQELIAEMAEVAGQLLRENGLFSVNEYPDIDIADEPWAMPCIFITFRVNVSYEKAADLYEQLADRLFRKFEEIPESVHIAFRSAQ